MSIMQASKDVAMDIGGGSLATSKPLFRHTEATVKRVYDLHALDIHMHAADLCFIVLCVYMHPSTRPSLPVHTKKLRELLRLPHCCHSAYVCIYAMQSTHPLSTGSLIPEPLH